MHKFAMGGISIFLGGEILESLMALMTEGIALMLRALPREIKQSLEEIRFRKDRPLQIRWGGGEGWVREGGISPDFREGYRVTGEDILHILQALTRSSLYAWEEELRQGYITLPGGHRVGLVGEAVVAQGGIKTLKNFSSLNLRLARSLKGCGLPLFPRLLQGQRFLNTLILSPPRCGKTTLLRNLIRLLSTGVPELGFPGLNVGVVDERSEIAGC